MAGGLLFSQFLTLYTTPVLYTYLDGIGARFGRAESYGPAREDT